jgi:hypothetical protein
MAQHRQVSPSRLTSQPHHLFEKLWDNERAAAGAAAIRLGLIL